VQFSIIHSTFRKSGAKKRDPPYPLLENPLLEKVEQNPESTRLSFNSTLDKITD